MGTLRYTAATRYTANMAAVTILDRTTSFTHIKSLTRRSLSNCTIALYILFIYF